MVKQNALESEQISLTLPKTWLKELWKQADIYFLTPQDIIREQIRKYIDSLPKKD